MASMKRGRKTGSVTPSADPGLPTPPVITRQPSPALPESTGSLQVDLPVIARQTSPTTLQAPAVVQATLEDEVAALEQEVLGLQNAGPESMDIDESEEGEISDIEEEVPRPATPLSLPLPRIPPIMPSKTPVQLNRSIKRPNADDMMDGRGSIHARSLHPPKRRIFGRAIRPTSLTVRLDDSDDDSDSDNESSAMSAAQLEAERQRLLKEKEDNINRLREKILRLQARAAKDKKAKIKEAPPAAAAMEQKALDDVIADAVQDVVMGEASVAAGESYCWSLARTC
jgi:hypothetical protein